MNQYTSLQRLLTLSTTLSMSLASAAMFNGTELSDIGIIAKSTFGALVGLPSGWLMGWLFRKSAKKLQERQLELIVDQTGQEARRIYDLVRKNPKILLVLQKSAQKARESVKANPHNEGKSNQERSYFAAFRKRTKTKFRNRTKSSVVIPMPPDTRAPTTKKQGPRAFKAMQPMSSARSVSGTPEQETERRSEIELAATFGATPRERDELSGSSPVPPPPLPPIVPPTKNEEGGSSGNDGEASGDTRPSPLMKASRKIIIKPKVGGKKQRHIIIKRPAIAGIVAASTADLDDDEGEAKLLSKATTKIKIGDRKPTHRSSKWKKRLKVRKRNAGPSISQLAQMTQDGTLNSPFIIKKSGVLSKALKVIQQTKSVNDKSNQPNVFNEVGSMTKARKTESLSLLKQRLENFNRIVGEKKQFKKKTRWIIFIVALTLGFIWNAASTTMSLVWGMQFDIMQAKSGDTSGSRVTDWILMWFISILIDMLIVKPTVMFGKIVGKSLKARNKEKLLKKRSGNQGASLGVFASVVHDSEAARAKALKSFREFVFADDE